MRKAAVFLTWIFVLTVAGPDAAWSQSTVAILMPGAGGPGPNDFLMRNQNQINAAGIQTIVVTSPPQAAAIANTESAKGRKVVIVGMSRGGIHAATALADGARVTGAVFVSANFRKITSILGSPARLPATLVVHHPRDQCQKTSPQGAERFARWAGGKARLVWIDTSGRPTRKVCGPDGAHGFYRNDGQAIAAITSFIRSR